MKANEAMRLFGKSVSIKNRLLLALCGCLCLFFPGFVLMVAAKSVAAVFKNLPAEDQAILTTILFSQND